MGHVWVQNGPFAQTSLFSEKSLILFSLTCWPISLCKILKNFLQWTKSYEDAPFLGPKMEAHLPKRKFFQKIWFLSFMSIYTPKVNVDINLLMKYWQLKNGWEPFLAITWEPDFSQACTFRKMLKDHKNFRSTSIPDKSNNLIFLKRPKYRCFWPVLTIFDITFSKKILLCLM